MLWRNKKQEENKTMTKKKYGTRWLCTTALLMAMNIIMSMSEAKQMMTSFR